MYRGEYSSGVKFVLQKLNIPLGPGLRARSLEADLQPRIDDGHSVYIIGDVHCHLDNFRALKE